MRGALVSAVVTVWPAFACGNGSSSPSAAVDASGVDARGDASSSSSSGSSSGSGSGGDASDACTVVDAAAACGCQDTAPFAPSDPAGCEGCLRARCAGQLASYESSCWVLQGCVCSCSGFDDTCTNNAQPYLACGQSSCAAACAGGDAAAPGDAAGD
jgi:hypothetical protein